MNQITTYPGESSMTTGVSVSAFTEFANLPPPTSTRPSAPIQNIVLSDLSAVETVDIDDLVAEFKRMPGGAEALADGRKWVAEAYYPDAQATIAGLRLKLGWSQAELARRSKTSQSYIARLELGQVDPQVSTIKKIAAALNISTGEIAQILAKGADK